MDHFAGLDVSVKETSVCIVDGTGKIVREVKVASEPDALLAVLINPAYRFKRIGLEAGPLAQWLFSGLAPGEVFTGRKPDLCEARNFWSICRRGCRETPVQEPSRRCPGCSRRYFKRYWAHPTIDE
jgi:hypothetical protein